MNHIRTCLLGLLLVAWLPAEEPSLAGVSAQIFVITGDSFTEGRLNFKDGKHMLVTGAVNNAIGLVGGTYALGGEGNQSGFTCTVKLNTNGIATISWRGTIDKGDDSRPATAEGSVTVTFQASDRKPSTLKFSGKRPVAKGR